MNPGPAPTIVTFLIAASTICLALGVLAWLADRNQPEPEPEPARDSSHCQIGDCHEPAWSVYDRHPAGWLWVCRGHDAIVQEWTGAFRRVRSIEPFDQKAS
jgi:hypothetical protein